MAASLLDVVQQCCAALSGEGVDGVRGSLPVERSVVADAQRVALIEALELLKRAACAVQGEAAVDLEASVRAQHAAAGLPAGQRGRGVAGQVGLARRESPHRAQVFLGAARAWRCELPHTRAALAAGVVDEHTATLVVRETACLEPADRARVDREVFAEPSTIAGWGTRQLVAHVRRRAQSLDPAAAVRRARRAESERCVSLRPAPDTMAYLTALVPMTQGVAAYAALRRDADTAIATGQATGPDGQPRGRGQVMADLLVQRLTGQQAADVVPVEVTLVLSDATLLGAGAEPGVLVADGVGTAGAGVIPAQVAREVLARATEADLAWVRRLYAAGDGDLVALSSRQRFVRGGLAAFLRARDQGTCRTPWCDAPVAHHDHVTDVAAGGTTTATDTQGLCQACNHTKQAPGWHTVTEVAAGPHTVRTTTPTGQTHTSRPPPPPEPATPAPPPPTWIDHALDQLMAEVFPTP